MGSKTDFYASNCTARWIPAFAGMTLFVEDKHHKSYLNINRLKSQSID